MKRIIVVSMGFLTLLFGCGPKTTPLTEQENQLCTGISYDCQLAAQLKAATGQSVTLIPAINEYGEVLDTTAEGLCAPVDEYKGYAFVRQHKKGFAAKGYLLFVFEGKRNQMYLAAIKGSNDFDILTWRQTNGINHDYETADIITKLEEWKRRNDFILLGVGMDWLNLYYPGSKPDFNQQFAEEVYEFCPDIVDQGVGDIPALIKEMKRTSEIYLWWD